MANWNKKEVSKEVTKELFEKYGINPIAASILIRRGIISGEDIQYFSENDKRFMHNPFEFANMSDAVERILQAQEEGEKVLIFGDKDVDGITATTVLYNCLKQMQIDVRWQLPGPNDPYGLNIEAIDNFAKDYGTLIITVDCGITNIEEINHASSLGIDTIVVDHHNPPEEIPENAIIINPKCKDSGYPFKDISGCAVTYKLTTALRFSKSELYNNEVCLLSIRPVNEAYTIECIKTENLVQTDYLSETIVPGTLSFSQTHLSNFLKGVQIFVWDERTTSKMLRETFGNNIEFALVDLQTEVAKIFPKIGAMSLIRLKAMSKIAKYNPKFATEIYGFFNIFVTFMTKVYYDQFKNHAIEENSDLQLVALSTLSDIMPLVDENRIFLKQALQSFNEGNIRSGLKELFLSKQLTSKKITSTDISWEIVPLLNSTGRLGVPEKGVELFLEEESSKIFEKVEEIKELNSKRKDLCNDGLNIALKKCEESIAKYNNKFCVVIDENINRGIAGIIAGRLVNKFNIPSMVITIVDDLACGSMRSCRGCSTTSFLKQMADIFVNFGGHDQAAGFSLEKNRLEEFQEKLDFFIPAINLDEEVEQDSNIDAEIPVAYMKKDLINIIDFFEPYGEQNDKLLFMTKGLKILDAILIGKSEPYTVKLTLDAKTSKWPALYWNKGECLNRDFSKGDSVDILYEINRNYFNNVETLQLIINDIKLSS